MKRKKSLTEEGHVAAANHLERTFQSLNSLEKEIISAYSKNSKYNLVLIKLDKNLLHLKNLLEEIYFSEYPSKPYSPYRPYLKL